MKKRFFAIILAGLLLCSTLSACGLKDLLPSGNDDTNDTSSVVEAKDEKTDEKTDKDTDDDKAEIKTTENRVLSAPKAKKLTTVEIASLTPTKGGWYYQSGDKYGILSADGSKDTTAKYVYVTNEGGLFAVASKAPSNSDVKSNNCFGLVNGDGKALTEEKYAAFSQINDRYYQLIEVTEQTDDQDEALMFMSDNEFAIFADEDDTFFKGKWYILDTEKGEIVKDVTGTTAQTITSNGDFFTYETDDGEKVTIDGDGKKVTDEINLFLDGSYEKVNGSEATVYDSDGKKLFSYNQDLFYINDATGDYFYAYDVDNSFYVIIDKKGERVSSGFDDIPEVIGNVIVTNKGVYDFDKNELYKSEGYLYAEQDSVSKAVFMAYDDKTVLYFDNDGKILASIEKTDEITPYTSDMLVCQNRDSVYKFYNLKTKTFDIEGSSLNHWLVTIGEYGERTIVDAIEGNTVLDEKYDSISASYKTEDGKVYVAGKLEEGGYDIYELKF